MQSKIGTPKIDPPKKDCTKDPLAKDCTQVELQLTNHSPGKVWARSGQMCTERLRSQRWTQLLIFQQNDIHNRKYMAQYYRLNYKSPLALGSYFKKNLSPKRRPNFVEMLFYDARYSKNKNIWQPDSFSNGLAYTANNMRGPKAWYDRTNGGNRFIYAYSAGCWTKVHSKISFQMVESVTLSMSSDSNFHSAFANP